MSADSDRLEVYEATDGWRWKRVAANNRTLCTGESHARQADAERASLRACPDLDPAWMQPVRPADTTPLDLINRLLAPRDEDEREATRAELAQWLT